MTKIRLESAANVSVLVAVVLLLAFFGQQEYDRFHHSAQPAPASLAGTTITLPGVRFAPRGRTLVLAISTVCHFCKDSEPFYRKLAEQSQGRTKIVAVLPQPQADAQSYVHTSIAPSIDVISARLDSIGVRGTPTLLLVGGDGKVQQAWVGKLDDRGEKEVQKQVQAPTM